MSGTSNSDIMKVYINGSLQTNQSVGAAINFVNPVTSPFIIGTIGDYLTNKFVGQISQVSIFDYGSISDGGVSVGFTFRITNKHFIW